MRRMNSTNSMWWRGATFLALAVVAALGAAGCGGGSDSGATDRPAAKAGAAPSKPVTITVWHGNVDEVATTMRTLAKEFHATHPDITVKTEQGAPADAMATKLATVLSTDSYPDIGYLFGTDVPSLARSPKTVDLTAAVNDPTFGWDDFYVAERETATVGGNVFGVPAVVGNLGLVYNKKLFTEAGVAEPTADWSWDDYRAAAKKLTNADTKIFGAAYPIAGDEDTVWRFWPMIWQQGGKAISDDATSAPFDGPQYTKALELLRAMAIDDKSLYLDQNSDAIYELFASEKIGMVITGAFALQTFRDGKVDYGVAPLPAFDGDHQTVSGNDNWMVFDNGDDKVAASVEFLRFLTAAKQDAVWSVGLGNMPIRNATQATPAWKKVATEFPGFQAFADNFVNTKQKRPQTIAYPAYSLALGEQIAAVLTGQASVADALAEAKSHADAALLDSAG
jgi:multiple sugar transport system substrate-binding protein